MRVLVMCAAGIVSGKEIMSLHLLTQLKSKGHTVLCGVSSWGSKDFRQRLKDEGIHYTDLRMGFISKTLTWSAVQMTLVQAFYLPALWIKYIVLVRKFKPDVIIHTNFHHVFLLFPFLDASRSWYWSHEVTGNTNFYRRLFQVFERRIKGFIGVSEVVGASLRRILLKRPVVVINNGILFSSATSWQIRSDTERIVFGIVGQVSPHKGHEVLVNALRLLELQNWKLRIFGKGTPEYETYLKEKIEEAGLTAMCQWMGFVKSTDEIYESINVLVVPSIFQDPFPTTIMEAGVRGIPVVGSASGGIPEMIEEGVNGFLFKSGDALDLAHVLRKVTHRVDMSNWIGNCSAYARKRFGIDGFIKKFIETITQRHD